MPEGRLEQVIATLRSPSIWFLNAEGSVPTGTTVEFDPRPDHDVFVDAEDGEVVATFTISPCLPGMEVEANPHVALDVVLKDFALGRPSGKTLLRMPMATRLLLIESVIHSEVGRVEYDCMGFTRSDYIDKDWIGFKDPTQGQGSYPRPLGPLGVDRASPRTARYPLALPSR